ncbi:GntR family transcriptional regulator [Microbacterium azadirachtae]|uniref:GntR family transcriptional regulator n=1 Tax=Microbacterium azadirachtae TaxID=582680 RepID=UPI00088E2195|nr:GntR family transcriptional regulator [Microbacterium azadirachtae]SDL85779.1 transcriptional regulator, GntR family [Microbacterium azadirachtae]SEG21260.1 transcriptional regulator, GntR family [Microbacterium azadirachtae]SEG23573.1 transcriptional regulator, GntR family [Microbacterium azadirachtae]
MPEVVYTQIADDLRARIASGRLRPGDAVPTEAELAESWSTSRGPIRNALAALRAEGLIETARGRPARVVERKATQAVDVSVPFTRWARELGARPGARTQELSLRRAGVEKAQALGVDPDDTIVSVTRLRFLDDRPTMLERLFYTEEVGRLLLSVDTDAISITEFLASQGHPIVGLQHEIDAVAADEQDAALLQVPPGTPILRLSRTSRDAGGRIFEASEDRYLSSIVRFTVSGSGISPDGQYLRAVGG